MLVEVHAAGVNPSDVRAALGAMPHAVWPRTPGRDWAGIVLAGPKNRLGTQVFGSGGDLGISRDGTHAALLCLPAAAALPKPDAMTLEEAGALGVPFVTAHEGFRRSGAPRAGEVVLVLAANGRVGQAAVQVAAMHGAMVFGVVRRAEAFAGPPETPVTMIDSGTEDVAATVRAATGGHGADIVFNTVGSPYFAAGNAALAIGGRHILISSVQHEVQFNIFAFYRGRHTFVGVDTLTLNSTASAAALRDLLPGFISRTLRPFPVERRACFTLGQAIDAYKQVLGGTPDRVVVLPQQTEG
jgi:NADPH2:quinone reductase